MRAIIVEDESAASRRLVRLLNETAPHLKVEEVLETVSDTVAWLNLHQQPDLMFCDIHLADGSCFSIFRQVETKCPVIFITAYDQYAIEAFKVNGIDYILKPVKREDLALALNKYKTLVQRVDYQSLLDQLLEQRRDFQHRMIVKIGPRLKALEISQIALFYTEEGVVFMQTFEGQRFMPDLTLDKIMQMVDPMQFYRINRSQIVNQRAVVEMHIHTKGRLKLKLQVKHQQECMVSSDKVAGLKAWLTGAGKILQR